MWTLLLLTLPTQPNAVRLRIWRSLKAMGCAALRDGAYVLPREQGNRFEPLCAEVREHGGNASVLDLAARDDTQRREIEALFDRSEAYAQWRTGLQTLQAEMDALSEVEARRRFRQITDALESLRAIDFYAGAAAAQADSDVLALRDALDSRYSRGEPKPKPTAGIERLKRSAFSGKRWATRARPWVDRLACAWFIHRFIDPEAKFIWLDEALRAPRGAITFDFDGARFTHVGSLVTFEVLVASFAQDTDPRLTRIARSVHYLDAGGIPVPEARGLEAILAGLREVHADDHQLASAAAAVFDALYAVPLNDTAGGLS